MPVDLLLAKLIQSNIIDSDEFHLWRKQRNSQRYNPPPSASLPPPAQQQQQQRSTVETSSSRPTLGNDTSPSRPTTLPAWMWSNDLSDLQWDPNKRDWYVEDEDRQGNSYKLYYSENNSRF